MKTMLTYVMDIGEQMMLCGAEVHRVEDSVCRMCSAMGAERTDVFIITSSMVVTVHMPDGATHTQTRRIAGSGTDMERLHRLNQLSRRICSKPTAGEEIEAALAEIARTKHCPLWGEFLCYAGVAFAFTLFFGGSFQDAAVSSFIGAGLRLVILIANLLMRNTLFEKFLSAFMVTAMAFSVQRLGLVQGVDYVIIGNIMSLIPGIGLTNAVRDLLMGDSIAGLLRSFEALLAALAIAAGYFLCASVFGGVFV